MRLWTLHPENLDRIGLVALWREGLLAQAVLAGKTKGYKNHPQLERFKGTKNPLASIGFYLSHVQIEATKRGYLFDEKKIANLGKFPEKEKIPVKKGQIEYEIAHLTKKLKARSPKDLERLSGKASPSFTIVPGDCPESWEKL